jgi:hypothetical protein
MKSIANTGPKCVPPKGGDASFINPLEDILPVWYTIFRNLKNLFER